MFNILSTLSNNFWNICILWLSLSDFLITMVEANFLDNLISTSDTVISKLYQVKDDLMIAARYVRNNIENAVNSLTDMSAVDDEEVIFKYYNKDHPEGEPFSIMEFHESKLKGWRQDTLLKVITHGWRSSDQSESVSLIKDAYLAKHDCNLITVDWSGPAKHEYAISAAKTKGVGRIIAQLLNELVKKKLVTWEKVNAIGHSLGGHVMGVAGAYTTGKVGRLLALDPAGPIFNEIERPDCRALDSTDAAFVEVIHTSGGEIGLGPDSNSGHADFYPNGGIHPQPGCSDLDAIICSHRRAYNFFTESIMNPAAFIGRQCDSWAAFKDGECDNNASEAMGDPTPTRTVNLVVNLHARVVGKGVEIHYSVISQNCTPCVIYYLWQETPTSRYDMGDFTKM